jgi:hydroxypyruvate isomerase
MVTALADRLISVTPPTCRHGSPAGPNGRHEPDGEAAAVMLDLLEQSGYVGYVGCEYNPAQGTSQGLAWAKRFGIEPP